MTEYSTSKAIFPFSLVSSSISGGFIDQFRTEIGVLGIDIINNHTEYYGSFKENPLQGPFTEKWVGGFQHRHIRLNTGSQTISNRPELYHVTASDQHIRIYNHRFGRKPACIFF